MTLIWCAECGKNLAGGPPGPGATLHADCLYCETRPYGPVKRTRPASPAPHTEETTSRE